MRNSDGSKPGSSKSAPSAPSTTRAEPAFGRVGPGKSVTAHGGAGKPAPAAHPNDNTAGHIEHDERGNAVWKWIAETGRIFIGNTSRLLRKLDAPELKIDDGDPSELRIESDRDAGGGYDPYSSGSGRNRGP
jgi:hypothetical protein